MSSEATHERITLRIPRDLHQKLVEAASKRSPAYSLNSEILERLYDSFSGRPNAAEVEARLNELEASTKAGLNEAQARALKAVQDAETGKAYIEELRRRLAEIEDRYARVKVTSCGDRSEIGVVVEVERLETPRQLADRVGLSERQVRHLIQTRQLEYVMVGSRIHIPRGAFARFVDANRVTPCQDETKVPAFVGSTNASASTSPGPNTAAAASARLARQTANKLKSSSQSGSNVRGRRDGPSDPAADARDRRAERLSERARTEGRGTRAHRLCRAGVDRLLRGQHHRRRDAPDMRSLRRETRAL